MFILKSIYYYTKCINHTGNLSDIHTQDIVPVDLNSILHVNALTLSTWFAQMGNKTKAEKYSKIALEIQTNIQEVNIKNNTLFDVSYLYFK